MPEQVSAHLHNDLTVAPHGILYDILPLSARGGLPFFPRACVASGGSTLLRCVGYVLHSVFVFRPSPEGRKPLRKIRVKNDIWEEEMHENTSLLAKQYRASMRDRGGDFT